MSSNFGNNLKISVFGQSHSQGIGVLIDGLPAGQTLDMEQIMQFMARRAPGRDEFSTPRKEADKPEIISGLKEGKTCGAPLCAIIANNDTRSQDYEKLKYIPRPAHSDYPAFVKYCGENDNAGGGHFSGRLTAPLCFAGAVCIQILNKNGITIGAHINSISNIVDKAFDPVNITHDELLNAGKKAFPVNDDNAGNDMKDKILKAKNDLDSVGGTIECCVIGLNPGIGEPMFDGVENRLAAAIFAIPAVKGLEFGDGFKCSTLMGSENNDEFYYDDDTVKTRTNHNGGVLGGLTTGMPLIFKVAFKPTPSIAKEQKTVDLKNEKDTVLKIEGRHDPCIVPRAVPCVEAVTAIAILDMLL